MTRHAQLRHQDEAFAEHHYKSGLFFGFIVGLVVGVVACSGMAIFAALFWR